LQLKTFKIAFLKIGFLILPVKINAARVSTRAKTPRYPQNHENVISIFR